MSKEKDFIEINPILLIRIGLVIIIIVLLFLNLLGVVFIPFFEIMILIIFVGMISGGVYSLIKYKKTKEKKYLILGLILTFIVIGILVYIFTTTPSTMMDYGPPEMM